MTCLNCRIFVEKKPRYRTEAEDLFKDLKDNLRIKARSLRLINCYDVFDIEETVLEKAKQSVFSEAMVDDLLEFVEITKDTGFAKEYLPGQYDQRADSAMQAIRLLDPSGCCTIRSGQIILLQGSDAEEIEKIKKYCINPIEARQKDLSILKMDQNVDVKPLEDFSGFNDFNQEELEAFRIEQGLAMSFKDIELVQKYFRDEEKRIPTETEIRVLDTYWSDHCRHTTFETCLRSVTIEKSNFHAEIQRAYDTYLKMKHELARDDKPQTLMEMATINSRLFRQQGLLKDMEVSDEINACNVYIDVDHDGVMEKWLLMFKNETHNHPTEIEPFGGASTCIGGAIRDPLSGRSYVYQAMRISGCGNILEDLDQTLPGKLPQRVISKKAAQGNSSYGNQIGLPTTYVKEIFHPNYVAKHMEVGAVVGAVKAEYVRREKPQAGDIVLLLGGRTGRDGVGGATGSSKEHNEKSLEICASEVQKGNALQERKLQRLFRNPQVTRLIKKCNDFGAGGVSVAIGELADGLVIDLDQVRCKYAGLNATEIAISESQERMAVVIAKKDKEKFIKLAQLENLEAYEVAEISEAPRLVMNYHGKKVVDLARAFIDTNGVRQAVDAIITDSHEKNPFHKTKALTKESILETMGEMNVACQKGLVEMFDASINSTTVLMPFGGKTQLTPTQASVQKIPVYSGKTKTCSIMAAGFDPEISSYSPFLGAQYAVLDSLAKTVAVGGGLASVHFSFQEYFERLNQDAERWGKPIQALLGSIVVQNAFGKAAIGGKDSMSGTFKDLDVPPTLISFACSVANTDNIISAHLKQSGNKLTAFIPHMDERGLPDLESYRSIFASVEKGIRDKKIVSAYVAEQGGLIAACLKMSFGNKLGFSISTDEDLFRLVPGMIVVETKEKLTAPYAVAIGEVTKQDYRINKVSLTYEEAVEAWCRPLQAVYPIADNVNKETIEIRDTSCAEHFKSKYPVDEVHVCIPVFPGTNCEYDMARAFEEEGAVAHIQVFGNLDEQAIEKSIEELCGTMDQSQILAIPGGFSSGDEPDGSAKFIVNVLQNEKVKAAVERLLARDGLILGICNGFQALIKSGLLPTGKIEQRDQTCPTLFRNTINRHISTIATTRTASNKSPWLSSFQPGDIHKIPVSHGEGRFVASEKVLEKLFANGQVAFQYCDENGLPSNSGEWNINHSDMAIEGIISEDGHILGKMGHSERYCQDVFKNIDGNKKQNIFKNGVDYFKR